MRGIMIGLAAGLSLVSLSASAQDILHRGYETPSGSYVEPHYQTRPDSDPFNNYSTRGNTNPYTGREGTVDPFAAERRSESRSFGGGHLFDSSPSYDGARSRYR